MVIKVLLSCPELLCKKVALKSFAKFTGKHLRQKKRLRYTYFPVIFAKFLRTSFLPSTDDCVEINYKFNSSQICL